jgi:hypothetical protein
MMMRIEKRSLGFASSRSPTARPFRTDHGMGQSFRGPVLRVCPNNASSSYFCIGSRKP